MSRIRTVGLAVGLFVTMVAAAACGGQTKPAPAVQSGAQGGAESWPKREIRISSIYADGQNESKAVRYFAENVTKRTNGAITFKVHVGTALGTQDEINELLKSGGLEMAVHGQAMTPQYSALFLPYAVGDSTHLDKIMKSEIGAGWAKSLREQKGLTMLGVWNRGDRQTYLKQPVTKFEDLKGKKVRAPQLKTLIDVIKSWESVPVVLAYGEIYQSIASGAIDGAEGPLGQIVAEKHYEVAKHVLLTGHGISPVMWYSNGKWFDGLDAKVKAMLQEEVDKAVTWVNAENKKVEQDAAEQLKAKGVTITKPASMDPFIKAAATMLDPEAEKAWGKDAWAKIKGMR